jgi:hypothetical protein
MEAGSGVCFGALWRRQETIEGTGPVLDSYPLNARLESHQIATGRRNHGDTEAGSGVRFGALCRLQEIIEGPVGVEGAIADA